MRDNKTCIKYKLNLFLYLVLFLIWFVMYFLNGFFFGYRTTFVLTGSMEPDIPVASLLIEKKFNDEDVLQVGDVISFLANDDSSTLRVTHRIIKIDEDRVYTKGDANPEADHFQVYKSDVESMVIFVYPYFLPTLSFFIILGIIISQLKNRYKNSQVTSVYSNS